MAYKLKDKNVSISVAASVARPNLDYDEELLSKSHGRPKQLLNVERDHAKEWNQHNAGQIRPTNEYSILHHQDQRQSNESEQPVKKLGSTNNGQ
jgi:hypothetical protein